MLTAEKQSMYTAWPAKDRQSVQLGIKPLRRNGNRDDRGVSHFAATSAEKADLLLKGGGGFVCSETRFRGRCRGRNTDKHWPYRHA